MSGGRGVGRGGCDRLVRRNDGRVGAKADATGAVAAGVGVCACAFAMLTAQDGPEARNTIIFVADGFRHGSVNAIDTPAL